MSEVKEENKLHTKRYWVILGAIIGALVVGFFIFDAMKYQSTDDAYVETTTVQILNNYGAGTAGASSVQKTYNIGEDNGIKVQITPFISPDGYVSLTIKPDYASVYREINDEYMGSTYLAATLLQRHNLDLMQIFRNSEQS